MAQPARDSLVRALDVLESAADVVRERVGEAGAPAWAERRGWTEFLERLDDRELELCEEQGLARALQALPEAPASLSALAREVTAATQLTLLGAEAVEPPALALQGVGARKQHQLAALIAAIGPMAAHKRRIVDVGAGKGHFGRVASETLGKDVLGIERDAERVSAALALAAGTSLATFVRLDVFSEAIPLGPDDLAVGLHACGEVGDRTASAAAAIGSDLALVSCCLQKIREPARAPLSLTAKQRGAVLPREILGLSNLTSRAEGVERPLAASLRAREHRLALRLLLKGRGITPEHGEELRGINRRQAHAGLPRIASLALALRGLPPATSPELELAAAEARRRWAEMRRWGLPRAMLARLIEVAVSYDRATLLEEHGLAASVVALVDPSVTTRNVAVFASRARERLPR